MTAKSHGLKSGDTLRPAIASPGLCAADPRCTSNVARLSLVRYLKPLHDRIMLIAPYPVFHNNKGIASSDTGKKYIFYRAGSVCQCSARSSKHRSRYECLCDQSTVERYLALIQAVAAWWRVWLSNL